VIKVTQACDERRGTLCPRLRNLLSSPELLHRSGWSAAMTAWRVCGGLCEICGGLRNLLTT